MSNGEQPGSGDEDMATRLSDWVASKRYELDKAAEVLRFDPPDIFSPTVDVLESIRAAGVLNGRQEMLNELEQFLPPKP